MNYYPLFLRFRKFFMNFCKMHTSFIFEHIIDFLVVNVVTQLYKITNAKEFTKYLNKK